MFNIFKKKETKKENNHPSIIAVACLLIHSAKIDEHYTAKEKKIIKDAIIQMGAESKEIDKIILDAEEKEKDSNQILDFTREIKNSEEMFKKKVIESLWKIIFSDGTSDMYEANFMRRIAGLIYIDSKMMGDIKEKVKKNIIK